MLVTALLIIGGLLFAGPVIFGLIIARWQKEWGRPIATALSPELSGNKIVRCNDLLLPLAELRCAHDYGICLTRGNSATQRGG